MIEFSFDDPNTIDTDSDIDVRIRTAIVSYYYGQVSRSDKRICKDKQQSDN